MTVPVWLGEAFAGALPVLNLCAVHVILAIGAYYAFATSELVVCVGTFAGIGAVATAAAANVVAFPLALLLGMLAAAVAGALVGLLSIRLRGLRFALATIAISELARITVTGTDALGGALGVRSTIALPHPAWPLASALGVTTLAVAFEFSTARRVLSAVREGGVTASALGINAGAVRLLTLLAAGALSGLAGGLYLHMVGLFEARLFGADFGVSVLAFCFVGGPMNVLGPVVGATALTLVPEVMRFAQAWRMALYGGVLVAVAVFRPNGLYPARMVGFGARRLLRRSSSSLRH